MRFWLKQEERRPSPAPPHTDDRAAFLAGLILWVVALGLIVRFFEPLRVAGHEWWLWTGVTGVVLGLLGLGYAQLRRRGRV